VKFLVLNEFLVALGLKDNMTAQLDKATKGAEQKVGKMAASFAKNFAIAGTAVAGFMAATALGLLKFSSNLAKADDELNKFARSMGLPKEEAYKVKSALDIMGKSMQEIALNPVLMKQFSELKANAADFKLPDMTEALKPFREMSTEFLKIKQTASNALQWVGYHFLKHVQKPMDDIKKLFGGFNDTIKKNIPEWGANIGKALAWLVQLGGTVLRGAGILFTAIKRIFDMIPTNVKIVMAVLAGLFAFLKMSPIGRFITLITIAILLLDDFFTFLDGGESVIGDFFESMGISADDVREAITNAWNAITSFLTRTWDTIENAATTIWNRLKNFWSENGESIKTTLLSLWGKLKDTLSALWNLIKTIAITVFNALKTFWETWGDTILSIFSTTWGLIVDTFGNTLDIITNIFNLFTALFKGDWESAWESVKKIASSLWNQITSVFTAAKDTIVNVFNKLYDVIGPFAAVIAGIAAAVVAYKAVVIATTAVKGLMAAATSGMTIKTIAQTVASNAAAAAQWLLNAAMSANPIGLIIALIAGLVVGFVILWNKSEGFRNFFINLWEKIKSVVGAVVDAVVGFFTRAWENITGIWGAVVEWFSGIWDGIKNAFSNVGNWFRDRFEGAKRGVQNAWGSVAKWFSGVWEGIKGAFSAADGWLSDKFGDAWNNIKAVWNAVIGFFTGIWDGIKGVFDGTGSWTDIFTNAWDGIKNIWNAVIGWFTGIWDGIKGAFNVATSWFGGIFTDAWDGIKGIFDGAGEWFGGVWEGIKGTFSSVVEFFSDVFGRAVDSIKTVFNGVKEFFTTLFEAIVNIVKAPINYIIAGINDFIEGLNEIQIPDWVPVVGGKGLSFPTIALLEKGGVLGKGQMGLLEGTGAEAVVPLEKNTEWIKKVAQAFVRETGGDAGGNLEKLNVIMGKLESVIETLAAAIGKTMGDITSVMSGGDLSGLGEKMSGFLDNANKIMAQTGQSTAASYSTTSNSASYDSRSYDQSSTFNISDTSGNPRALAEMVDRNQSLRIRNMRGAFA
jgi:phage-related protein